MPCLSVPLTHPPTHPPQDTTRKAKEGSIWQQREWDQKKGVVNEAKNKHKLGGTGDLESAGRRKKKD